MSLPPPDLAVLLATSGHSGVDRVMGNLLAAWGEAGLRIDLLGIRGHGPHIDPLPPGVRRVPLPARHVSTALPALLRYLRRVRPPLLLTDKDRVNRLALLASALTGGHTPVAVRLGTTVSVNLADRGAVERRVQRLSMRHLYPRAAAVLVPSQGAADDLAAFAGLPRERIRVVPSPVLTADLAARMAQPPQGVDWPPDGPPTVLGIGELCARKDFETLIRAFAGLRAARPCRLVILGEGRQRTRLEALVTQLGLGGHVQLPGFVANPYPHLARAALFVLASRCEGMPVALIEALACGAPVVSTDCPSGPRELLQDGQIGPLVPVGDVAALTRAMAGTLDAPPPRAVLQGAAAPYAARRAAGAYLAALGLPLPAALA